MALPVPNLDNRTFEQLLQEARKSIPNYASQWTNHNPADPGITLVELFAWLVEITSYRINLVTDEHRLKYLKLLGIRPQGILHATADLSFEIDKVMDEVIPLEKDTVFLAEKAGENIEFEFSEGITVIPVQLEKIIVNEMSVVLSQASSTNFSQTPKLSKGVFDRTEANSKEDLFFAPFGLETRENSKLYLGFKLKTQENLRKDREYPYELLNLMCYLYENDLPAPGKHGEEAEYSFENAKLKWAISSPEGKPWKEVFPEDRTQNFRKSGSLLFKNLEGWTCSSLETLLYKENKERYFWLCCTLLESEYEYPPRIEKINLNVATVVQKKRVIYGMLEKSNGFSGQVFKLPETPVLRGSLKLALDGEEWKEVEDFDGSGPESPHFTLDSMKGEIRFGDGLQGKVPPKGTEIQALEYETTRGDQGNLPAGSRWAVKGEKPEGLTISNLKPAVGGKREESIDEAFERFIRDLRRVPYRAVTSEDFEYIARETPGLRIAQAKVIPNFDPYRQAEREGVVTVVIIPFSPLNVLETPPEPSPGFRAAVARHLEKHRLLGTRVYVVSPEYVRVEVKVTLEISRGFFKEEIRKAVLEKLNLHLHPAKGGQNGKGWPVGKPVYRSEIYRLIMETEGVGLINKMNISAQKGAKSDENGDLILTSKTATVYSGKHSVEIQAFS